MIDLDTGMSRSMELSVPFEGKVSEPKHNYSTTTSPDGTKSIRAMGPYMMGVTILEVDRDRLHITLGMEDWHRAIEVPIRELEAEKSSEIPSEGPTPDLIDVSRSAVLIKRRATIPATSPRPASGRSPMRRLLPSVCFALLTFATAASAEDWFLLDGTNGWTGSNLKHPVAAKLKEAVNGRSKLSGIAIAPDGNWIVLSGNNGYSTSNLDLPAQEARGIRAEERDPVHRLHSDGGWALFFGNGRILGPGHSRKRLQEDRRDEKTRRPAALIAFAPGGGWVLLFDEAGVLYDDVPTGLAKVLDGAVKKRQPIRCVAFADTGDSVCAGPQRLVDQQPRTSGRQARRSCARKTRTFAGSPWRCPTSGRVASGSRRNLPSA